MYRKLLTSVILFGSLMQAQTVLLNEDFESYTDFTISNFGQWQNLDIDKYGVYVFGGDLDRGWAPNWPNAYSPQAFMIFNPSKSNATNYSYAQQAADGANAEVDIRDFTPHSGSKFAGAWSSDWVTSNQLNVDWLVSPAVTLGTSGNTVSFYVKAANGSYDDHYKVGIYTGTGTPTSAADFTYITPSDVVVSYAIASDGYTRAGYDANGWRLDTYNLDAYAGKTIKVGINYVSPAMSSMLMVDDFKIVTTGTVLGVSDVQKTAEVSVYPNPTTNTFSVKSEEKIDKIKIYNTSGNLLSTINSNTADISNYPKGIYILEISTINGKTTTKKLIKK